MKKVLKNILLILDKKEKKQFLSLMMCDIIVSIFDILFLACLLLLIQFYIQPTTAGKVSFLPAWLFNRNSAWLISIFLLLFSIKNLCAFLITRSNYAFINGVSNRISCNNLVNYQNSAFSDFTGIDSSVYIRNIHNQPLEFSQYMLAGFQQLVTQLALMLVTIIAILLFNAKIFLLLLVLLLPPVIIVFWFIKRRLSITKKSIQQNNELSFKYMLDALKGYVEGNVYNRNAFFLNRFAGARQKFSKAVFDSMALQSLPGRIIEIFAILGLFILIVIATWAGSSDNNMLITIGAFMAAAYKIIPGIVKLINVSGLMKTYELSLETGDLNKKTVVVKTEQYDRETLHTVELKNIDFTYSGQPVLHQFSMTINKADFIGITAESGKGKTTLMNVLLGFLKAEGGEIYCNGKAVNSEEIKKYWPSVSYVRQQSFFIHDTILRNITLQEDDYDPMQLDHALQISGLQELIKQWPEGIKKIITENGKNISGGQQQRICIARALYKNASLLFLDEPFNELDEESTAILLQHFKELAASGKSVVMITHDKKSLAYCNKIISLDAS